MNLVQFNTLSHSQFQNLRARIKRWHGLIRIFIHPLFERWRTQKNYADLQGDPVRIIEIEHGLRRLLQMSSDKTPPIFIFEEFEYLNKFEKWLSRIPTHRDSNRPIVIPTLPNQPMPYEFDPSVALHYYEGYPYPDSEYRRAQWGKVIELMCKAGVREIFIGGMQLEVMCGDDWTYKKPAVARCVGIALSYLSNEKAGPFHSELSAMIEPRRARDEYLLDFCVNDELIDD